MKRKQFFNTEMMILTVVSAVMLILLVSVGIGCLTDLKQADADQQNLYLLVLLGLIVVVLLLFIIVGIVFYSRYKYFVVKRERGKNLTNLTVEEVIPNMLDEVAGFYDKIMDEVEASGNLPCWQRGVYPNREYFEKAIASGTMFAVRHGTKMIGAFCLDKNPNGDYTVGRWGVELKEGEFFVIHAIALIREYQGQGIARHMLSYAVKLAKEQNAKAIRGDCTLLNGKAMRLFEAVGFKSCGVFDLGRNVAGASRFQLYEYIFED